MKQAAKDASAMDERGAGLAHVRFFPGLVGAEGSASGATKKAQLSMLWRLASRLERHKPNRVENVDKKEVGWHLALFRAVR